MGEEKAGKMADWKSIVATKQEQVRRLIPPAWHLPESVTKTLKLPFDENPTNVIALDIPRKSGLLSEIELDITENYDVRELLDTLAKGKFTSESVVTAYCKRATIAQELTNCLTETYFSQAIERAKYLDDFRAREGKLMGPLHGLPVSIKDMLDVKGSDSSIGFVSMLNKPKEKNTVLVDILLGLGAVIYCKTNIPQTLIGAESENNIFGKVLNPHNTTLTPGGSSGGEAALIALRGSILGVGTDIGGSIRIPALCCGTYGFKPSANRIPNTGETIPVLEGFGLLMPSTGPLAHSIDALSTFMKNVIDAHPAASDTISLDIPWRNLDALPAGTKLTIGVLAEDPSYPLHPPMKRALADVVGLLESQGHDLVNLPADRCHIANASEVCFQMFGLETATMQGHVEVSGEPLVATLSAPANIETPNFVPDLSNMDVVGKIATLNTRRSMIQDAWRRTWYSDKLDIVIEPGAQNTAVKHRKYGWPPYTIFLNLLDYPACIIPYSNASKEKDPEVMKIGKHQGGPDYNPDEVDGAPCHIQVFTPNLRDEDCLRYARLIDQCIKYTK